jgi:hypothetical protein
MSPTTRRPQRRTVAARTAAAVTTTERKSDNGADANVDPVDQTWQHTLDLARSMVGSSLGTSRALVQGLCEWQGAQAAYLEHASERIGEAAGKAERAPDWPSLLALQANLAGTQWMQAVQDIGELAEQAMQIESRWIERSRADATRLSQQWVGNQWLPGSVAGLGDIVDANTPLAMLTQAQAAMEQVSRLWTQALYDTSLPD